MTVTAKKLRLEFFQNRLKDTSFYVLSKITGPIQATPPTSSDQAAEPTSSVQAWAKTKQSQGRSQDFEKFRGPFEAVYPTFVADYLAATNTLADCIELELAPHPDPVFALWMYTLRFVAEHAHFFQPGTPRWPEGLLASFGQHMEKMTTVFSTPTNSS